MPSRPPVANDQGFTRLAPVACAIVVTLALFGCSRAHYRLGADRQTYRILERDTQDSRWTQPRLDITPDPRSRFFDPFDPDRPPLPPDDPAANRFMHEAYGMHGWKHWDKFGQVSNVENPQWTAYFDGMPFQGPTFPLPTIEKLGLSESVELGLIHSREYQEELENMYLAALSLTLNHYRFQVRPIGFLGEPGTSLFYEHQPDDASNLRLGTSNAGISKLLPAGGQFIAELTNNTLWLFAGSDQTGTASSLAFSLVQPLMRGAGREIAMENLTQAERNVLYAVRDFARFRKGFYTTIVTGQRPLPLPGSAGGGELAFLVRGARSPTVGFYFLLFQLQRVRNQQTNIRGLEGLIRELERLSEAGRATALDITQLRSSLATSRRRHTLIERSYYDQVDRYKVQLGLPPDQPVHIDDSLLDQFRFVNARILDLETRITRVDLTSDPAQWSQAAAAFAELYREAIAHLEALRTEIHDVERHWPERLRGLSDTDVARIEEDFQRDKAQFAELDRHVMELAAKLEDLRARASAPERLDDDQRATLLSELRQARRDSVRTTRELLGLQIGVRVELFSVTPVDLDLEQVARLGLRNRLDLMNRRGFVMDARRRLEIAADRLEATVDLVADGSVDTPALLGNDDPFDFRAKDSSFRVGVSVVTPLDRRAARNNFRAAEVSYQRARRNYMAAEDQVKLDVRSSLRQVKAQAVVLEINRQALRVAARELDQAVEFSERPGDGMRAGSQGVNISRALDNILDTQDELIEAWVDYESSRLSLYRDMGTMFIDPEGFWVEDRALDDGERAASAD